MEAVDTKQLVAKLQIWILENLPKNDLLQQVMIRLEEQDEQIERLMNRMDVLMNRMDEVSRLIREAQRIL